MPRLLRNTLRLGNFVFRNKGMLLIGIAAFAFGGAATAFLRLWGRKLASPDQETVKPERRVQAWPAAARGKGKYYRRDIYRAPPLPRENLVRH